MAEERKIPTGIIIGAGAAGAAIAGILIYLATRAKPPPPPPPGAATLYGIVMDANTGLPIEGVLVTIDGIVVNTDASGRYTFEDIDPGSYILAIMKFGYKPPDVQEVNLLADATLEVNATMSPLASYPISADFPSQADPGKEISVSHTVHLEYGSDYVYTVALELKGPKSMRLAYVKFVSADLQAEGGIFEKMLPMSETGGYTFSTTAKLDLPPGTYQVLSDAKLQVISEIKYKEGVPYGLSYSAEGSIWLGERMGWMQIGEVVPGVYNCIYCQIPFDSEAELVDHMEAYHPGKPYIYNIEFSHEDGDVYIDGKIYIPTQRAGAECHLWFSSDELHYHPSKSGFVYGHWRKNYPYGGGPYFGSFGTRVGCSRGSCAPGTYPLYSWFYVNYPGYDIPLECYWGTVHPTVGVYIGTITTRTVV